MSPGTHTTVVTVGYNSALVIGTMLRSVPAGVPVFVVDNASTDDTVAVAQAARPDATVIRMPENRGFGRACNAGAADAETEFLLFLNPDAALKPGAIDALEQAAGDTPDFAAANPMILNAKGRGRLKTSSKLRLPNGLPAPRLDAFSEMPVLSGAAFFVKTAAFQAVGGFDPGIFLYHEDHDLAVRLARTQGRLWHVPGAVVTHIGGTGTARSPDAARFKGYQMARSAVHVLSKEGKFAPLPRVLLAAVLGFVAPINLLSKRRRAKYVGQIQGAWSARRDTGTYQSR
ncbi:MAG: glycosyltransferase family 2 protein [Pseudomonadota bacterium]